MIHPDEIHAQDSVAARLRDRFPDAPAPLVIDAVANGFDRYVNARIRDFIELLVEREVTGKLQAPFTRAASGERLNGPAGWR